MKSSFSAIVVLLVYLALTIPSCIEAPKVVQGTVVSYDSSANLVVVRDECPPHDEITLSLQDADIGAEPEPNDVLRAAFRTEGDLHRAVRVMNLTRQQEIGLAASAGTTDRCRPPKE